MRFKEFKLNPLIEAILDEVSMSPSSLQAWLNSPASEGITMGIEFEMCVPNTIARSDGTGYYNFAHDVRLESIDDILKFFHTPDPTATRAELEKDFKEYRELFANFRVQRMVDQKDPYFDRIKAEYTDSAEPFDDAYNYLVQKYLENKDFSSCQQWLIDAFNASPAKIYNEYHSLLQIDPNNEKSQYLNGIADLAEIFSKVVNMPVDWSPGYHRVDRTPGVWIIEPDSSIAPKSAYDEGLEFISPPMPIKDMLAKLDTVWKWMSEYGCYTNGSTGLHTNISVPGYSIEKLDYVKLVVFSGDEHVLRQFGRIANDYCKSAAKHFINLDDEDGRLHLLRLMKSGSMTKASKLIHHGETVKYTSINTKKGYVEFRAPGGDYISKSPVELMNTAIRLAMSLKIACDDDAYRDEYAKKLYKIINPQEVEIVGYNDDKPITQVKQTSLLFARFLAGKLSRKDLRDTLNSMKMQRTPNAIPKPHYDGPGKLGQTILLSSVTSSPTAKDWLVWDIQDPSQTYNIHNSLDVIKKTLSTGLHTRDNKWAAAEIITTPQQN